MKEMNLNLWIRTGPLVAHDVDRSLFVFWNRGARFFLVYQDSEFGQGYGMVRGFVEVDSWETAQPPANHAEAIKQAAQWLREDRAAD